MYTSGKIVGRYAPSPTGQLHFGNLRTALLAWLHVRLQGGRFILRIEDLDLPRVVPNSADQILRDLDWLGLDWDGPVLYQSERNELYQSALSTLTARGLTYQCFCSRKNIQAATEASRGVMGVYPGTCKKLLLSDKSKALGSGKNSATRVIVPHHMLSAVGDFVVQRADSLFAYQLAVTVDDLDQGITDVVRGEDLLDSTSKQLYLAKLLKPDIFPINYRHAALMLDDNGSKMSKRDGSISADVWRCQGGTAEELLGYLAFTAGIIDVKKTININELIGLVDIDALFSVLS